MEKVLIIGAGHGGYAAAGDLVMKGFHVMMYELKAFQRNLFPLIESGRLKLTGEISGIVEAPEIMVDFKNAMADADVVLIMTHAGSHREIAEQMAPLVKENQLIVLVPGYTGGSLVFAKIFKERNAASGHYLAETNTTPYASRKINGQPAVHVKLYAKQILLSAFPAVHNEVAGERFRRLYPNAVLVDNALVTGFNNGNPVLNVPPAILNAGRIEKAEGDYYHFQEGVTPSVAKVLALLDDERMAVGEAAGIDVPSYLERVMNTGYVTTNSSWNDMIKTSPHLTAKGPDSLRHRYFTEDVPYGLVPWHDIARQEGVEVPLMTSFIHLSSALMGVDYFKHGRTLTDMGIAGIRGDDLHHYLQKGK